MKWGIPILIVCCALGYTSFAQSRNPDVTARTQAGVGDISTHVQLLGRT